jgi:hypothetical protein
LLLDNLLQGCKNIRTGQIIGIRQRPNAIFVANETQPDQPSFCVRFSVSSGEVCSVGQSVEECIPVNGEQADVVAVQLNLSIKQAIVNITPAIVIYDRGMRDFALLTGDLLRNTLERQDP